MRRVMAILGLVAVLAGLAACGSDDDETTTGGADGGAGTTAPDDTSGDDTSGDDTSGDDRRYEYTGTVLENDEHGPELCLPVMTMIYPPSCGGVPVEPWSWDDVEAQTEGATTWAEVHVVGTFDGRALVPTETPTAATGAPAGGDAGPDVSPLCDAEVVDAERLADTDFQAASAAADGMDQVTHTWLSHAERPVDEWVFNVLVDEGAEAVEAELRPLWGGGLCVEQRDVRSRDELAAIGDQLPEVLGDDVTVYARTPRVERGTLVVTVAVATDEMRAAVDDAFGDGVVRFEPILRPVD